MAFLPRGSVEGSLGYVNINKMLQRDLRPAFLKLFNLEEPLIQLSGPRKLLPIVSMTTVKGTIASLHEMPLFWWLVGRIPLVQIAKKVTCSKNL